jgi:hypothetical protein
MLQRRGRASAKVRRERPRVAGVPRITRKRVMRVAPLETAAPAPAAEESGEGDAKEG